MARRLDIISYGPGFIAQGHLCGHRAFLIVAGPSGDGEVAMQFEVIADEVRRSGLSRVHISAGVRGSRATVDLAHYLNEKVAGIEATVSFHAGETLDADPLVYESVLVVEPGDLFAPDELDRRAGSVSVHYWPGERTMRLLGDVCDAPFGFYLVLGPQDFGEAKLWLSQTRDSRWQLLPRPDYARVEDAELREMGAANAAKV